MNLSDIQKTDPPTPEEGIPMLLPALAQYREDERAYRAIQNQMLEWIDSRPNVAQLRNDLDMAQISQNVIRKEIDRMLLEWYSHQPQEVRKFNEAASVTVTKEVSEYDPEQVVTWARDKMPELFLFDERAFKDYAVKNFEKVKIPSVQFKNAVGTHIASDLEKFYAVTGKTDKVDAEDLLQISDILPPTI